MDNMFRVVGTTMGGATESVKYATEDFGNERGGYRFTARGYGR